MRQERGAGLPSTPATSSLAPLSPGTTWLSPGACLTAMMVAARPRLLLDTPWVGLGRGQYCAENTEDT